MKKDNEEVEVFMTSKMKKKITQSCCFIAAAVNELKRQGDTNI